MNVFALSDIHVDQTKNRLWLENLSNTDYRNDVLMLAGDISDQLDLIAASLEILLGKFAHVFFVPGNHELWLRHKEAEDSMTKFQQIMALCRSLGVKTTPQHMGEHKLWIVPLLSWYVGPDAGQHSLYVNKPGEDPTLQMWSDFFYTRWPQSSNKAADTLLAMNAPPQTVQGAVISFSHFLPRRELIFPNGKIHPITAPLPNDPNPTFNFSRVAGDSRLDVLLRRWGSTVHVYGHQHRNRDVVINGVRYVSQCLGYPLERERGLVLVDGPKLVYNSAAEHDQAI